MHCDKCPKKFKSKQGLASHYTWAHEIPSLKLGAGTSLDSISAIPKRSIEDDAKCVVSQLVLDVECKFAKEKIGEGRKGADDRKSYDNLFKLHILEQLDGGMCASDVALENNVHKSLVSKWSNSKNRTAIYHEAADQHKKLLTENR